MPVSGGIWNGECPAATAVITRLVRNCALERVIQYSRDSNFQPKKRGVLDRPVEPGDDTEFGNELSRLRELACDQALQRCDRLEILRRDLILRDHEIELGFDTEHQIDHVHRGETDVHQQRAGSDFGGNRILFEDRRHQ
jgi:hypothetical protein